MPCFAVMDRWRHEQECEPGPDGQAEPADGQDDGPQGSTANGFVFPFLLTLCAGVKWGGGGGLHGFCTVFALLGLGFVCFHDLFLHQGTLVTEVLVHSIENSKLSWVGREGMEVAWPLCCVCFVWFRICAYRY